MELIPVSSQEQASKKRFLPIFLENVFNGTLPAYDECPEEIDLDNTDFKNLLINFRRNADSKLIGLLRKFNRISRKEGRIEKDIRTDRDDLWDTEYYQSIYNINGKPISTEVRKGEVAGSNVKLKNAKEPHISKKRVFIHRHPSNQIFSPGDLRLTLIGLDPKKMLTTEEALFDRPPLTIQIVCADFGYYLVFPTKDTVVPTKLQVEEDWGNNVNPREKYLQKWDSIKQRFGNGKLQEFIGQKLGLFSSVFPNEVNDRGKELISLDRAIDLCQKYKMQLYFSSRETGEFKRIKSVIDLFPSLS